MGLVNWPLGYKAARRDTVIPSYDDQQRRRNKRDYRRAPQLSCKCGHPPIELPWVGVRPQICTVVLVRAPTHQQCRRRPNPLPAVAICGSVTVAALFAFIVWIWFVRTGRSSCTCMHWPWRRREAATQERQPTVLAPDDADAKLDRVGSAHDEPPRMLSVVVVHPGYQLDLGTTQGKSGCHARLAYATPRCPCTPAVP